jgi:hypothetical protein
VVAELGERRSAAGATLRILAQPLRAIPPYELGVVGRIGERALRGWLVKPLNGAQSCLHDPGQPGPDDALDRAASIMIRNGLYLAETRFLDGVEAYNRHVMVLRDGAMRGGGGFYYTVGSYTCSGGKWKGEMTSQEHSPIAGTYPWARKVISIGFTGTYSDDGAEFEATALAGKQSFRFKSIYRLLFAD